MPSSEPASGGLFVVRREHLILHLALETEGVGCRCDRPIRAYRSKLTVVDTIAILPPVLIELRLTVFFALVLSAAFPAPVIRAPRKADICASAHLQRRRR
jgi:hypothetical protein